MGANMRCEKNSLALLSSKRTKAFSRTRADEAFALPSFSDAAPPTVTIESPRRSGSVPKVEHCSKDVERLKQTMLQHESMFKEQLYELHRLYQVQRVLMEESKRKGSGPPRHPRSDSPSSNSSLLYNPVDPCKPKGETTRFWDAKELNKGSLCKKLSFFSDQIDINKTHEDKSYAERQIHSPFSKGSQRLVIDLECPAEEHTEIEVVEEKPLVRDMSRKTGENLHTWHANWQALQYNTSSAEGADLRSVSMHRESLIGSSTRRSLEDCFTPELQRHKEVPFFPLGPAKAGNSEANSCHIQTSPVTNLFGVRLDQESINSREQPILQAGKNIDLEEKWKEPQVSDTDARNRPTGESSKLPHWLLQGSAAKTSPVKLAPVQNSLWQHQTSPIALQRHDARKTDPSFFYDRVSSVSPQELSSSWPMSGTTLQFGEPFLRTLPQGKPSSGYFLDACRENVQGFHKVGQTSYLNENMPFFSHARDEKGAGCLQVPATGYVSSPAVSRQSPVFDMPATPAPFLQDPSSMRPTHGPPMPSWYPQQKAFSTLMPQLLKPGIPTQGTPNAYSGNNMPNAWGANSSVCEEAKPGNFFTRGSVDLGVAENKIDLKGSSLSFAAKPEVSSKRLIFGFMPTASDLELTLGLDLNVSDMPETPKTVEDPPSMFGIVTPQRGDSKVDSESKIMRNDFDLNVQSSGQGADSCCLAAESRAILTEAEPSSECEKSHGWQLPMSGDKAMFYREWPTSSDAKGKPEVAVANAIPSLWSVISSSMKAGSQREASPFAENPQATSVNGSMFGAGKCSNGSGLMSCESRSCLPISVLPKARDDLNSSSGELCQSSEVHISTHNVNAASPLKLPSKGAMEKLFEEASIMGRRQQPATLLAKPGCLHISQGGTAEALLVTKCVKASVNSGEKHAFETFEAADILLNLGLDLQAMMSIEDHDTDDQERALKWLADIIPQEEISGAGAGIGDCQIRESIFQGSEPPLESVGLQKRELDSFELSVLRLEPINPDTEKLCAPPIERWELTEDCSPHPNLRRRSQRRGRVGKDFQKEMLPSMASLSRQEIAEDLQIIEGLVKSATEAMARCSLSPKEEAPWLLPDLSSVKTSSSKAKGSRCCKTAAKQNHGLLRVCSWGESTRRRRMRRQRSQWMCLPPGLEPL